MTVDELEAVYHKAYREDYDTRAGIRAVMLALRDETGQSLAEMARKECCGRGVQTYGPPECCGMPDLVVTTEQVNKAFNDILGDAGEMVPLPPPPEVK